MSATSAALGWLVALPALAVLAVSRRELARRGELVARACHEVRGPLTSARLGLALAGRVGFGAQAGLAAVDLELRRAGLALEDLYAARVGRRARDRVESVALGPLLGDVAQAWTGFAAASGAEVVLEGTETEASVRADRLRLAQAVGNLVANAIEHGGGVVRLSMSAGTERARIEVTDDGPGLPMPVAELTARAAGGRGRRGRGLAIAAEIAARHGGRLAGAPSARGARLAIELPLVEATRAARA